MALLNPAPIVDEIQGKSEQPGIAPTFEGFAEGPYVLQFKWTSAPDPATRNAVFQRWATWFHARMNDDEGAGTSGTPQISHNSTYTEVRWNRLDGAPTDAEKASVVAGLSV